MPVPKDSLLSRQIPNYVAVSPCRIWFPFSVSVGQFPLFKVKVTWADLSQMKHQLDATLCRLVYEYILAGRGNVGWSRKRWSLYGAAYTMLLLLMTVMNTHMESHSLVILIFVSRDNLSWTFKSSETPTWCNTVHVLFLQSHSTCFGRKRPSSGVFKTSTAATGTCVIVAGKSSHLLIRAGRP